MFSLSGQLWFLFSLFKLVGSPCATLWKKGLCCLFSFSSFSLLSTAHLLYYLLSLLFFFLYWCPKLFSQSFLHQPHICFFLSYDELYACKSCKWHYTGGCVEHRKHLGSRWRSIVAIESIFLRDQSLKWGQDSEGKQWKTEIAQCKLKARHRSLFIFVVVTVLLKDLVLSTCHIQFSLYRPLAFSDHILCEVYFNSK